MEKISMRERTRLVIETAERRQIKGKAKLLRKGTSAPPFQGSALGEKKQSGRMGRQTSEFTIGRLTEGVALGREADSLREDRDVGWCISELLV